MASGTGRSDEARKYRALYKTKEWQALRHQVLMRDGLQCQHCGVFLLRGAVVHHKVPHKGDMALFHDPANLEAVCKPCHDGPLQRQDAKGFSDEVGLDGWPTDDKHPANR